MNQMIGAQDINTCHDTGHVSPRSSTVMQFVHCLMLFALIWSGQAFAVCSPSSSGWGPYASLPKSISVTQDELALGKQFPSSTSANTTGIVVTGTTDSCAFDELVITPLGNPIPNVTYDSGNNKTAAVFETGIPGIGYSLLISSTRGGILASTPVESGETSMKLSSTVENLNFYVTEIFVTAGGLITGSHRSTAKKLFNVRLKHKGQYVTESVGALDFYPASITVTARACKVTSGANNTVTLPVLLASSLKAVGDVASARSAPFSIDLRCDANLSVYATLTDATDPTNIGNALKLGKSSTAAGVGIQIMKKGTADPLKFGPDSSAKGNKNQWLVSKSSGANSAISVPFEARYVKTAPEIRTGSVSALSTITFSYQ